MKARRLCRLGLLPTLLLASAATPLQGAPAGGEDDCVSDVVLDVVAICNGVTITGREVDARIEDSLAAVRDALHQAREQELELLVNSALLEHEAAGRGQTTLELLEHEVMSKVKVPTDAEVRAFYEANRGRLPGGFLPNKAKIRAFLGQQRESAAAKRFAESLRASADVQVYTDRVDTRRVALDPGTPLASVDGVPITAGAVDEQLQALIPHVEEEIYRLRSDQVATIVDGLLLAQEAASRGLAVQDLLEAEVLPLVRVLTEEDVQAFYEQNKDRMDADYADPEGRARIVDHMRRAEASRARSLYTDRLRDAADIQLFLVSPREADERLLRPGEPALGPADAPVTVVVFLDYECTKCAQVHDALRGLVAELDGEVRMITRDFPLSSHVHAHTAALAAEAAREQGRYWEYATLLFHNQGALGTPKLKEYAGRLDLDQRRFDDALDSAKFNAQVEQDRRDALSLGVYSTPTVFVNGRRVEHRTAESLKRSIEEALRDRASSEEEPASAPGDEAPGARGGDSTQEADPGPEVGG